jgi:two-component system CheB/CheR fusion protein
VACLLASAGGLEALAEFFRQVPKRTGIAFLVLQHFPGESPSLLPDLLQRHSALPCRLGAAGDPVEPDQILVLAAGIGLERAEGRVRLAQRDPGAGVLAGDLLFESAALCLEDQAIAVVLSGTGQDGTTGCRAIQDRGGQTYVQSPATALFGAMPRHAIESGVADWVLPAGEMAKQMLEDRAGAAGAQLADRIGVLQAICESLSRRTANDFSRYKPGTLYRRINRRLQVTGARTLEEYLAILDETPDEASALLNDLLIRVTEFFRDLEPFESLASQLQQALRAGSGDAPFRIWVPGCSSGEEAYTLAILVRELLDRVGSARRVQIFATDIDTAALLQAKSGRYVAHALRKVAPDRLARFFVREGDAYRVAKELREMCVFSVQNILRDPPFSSLDLISCRNVFIYLQPALQRKLLPLFHFALKPGGLLFLGSAESLATHLDLFEPLDKVSRIYRRREVQKRPPIEFPVGDRRQAHRHGPPAASGGLEAAPPAADGLFERMLLQEYVPASAIINGAGDVLYCAGRIGRFLHPPLGAPNGNLLQCTTGRLRQELRGLLARVAGDPVGRVSSVLQHDAGMGDEILKITLRMLPGLDPGAGVIALVIETQPAGGTVLPAPRPGDGENPLLEQMERELRGTQAELQATVEELGSTSEEFRAANEELQTANEELQTSQEELQSVNEELSTLNNELQLKLQELREANGDLQNLLAATDIATVFLDLEMRISRFTPAAGRFFRIREGDLGRSIQDFTPLFEGADFASLALEVLATHGVRREQVHSPDGRRWHILQVLPYRSLAGEVTGVVATFVDISEMVAAHRSMMASEQRYRNLFDNMGNGFAHCRMRFEGDWPADFQYLSVNRAFELQTGLAGVAGKWVSEVIPGIRESDPELFERYGRVARTGVAERFELYLAALGQWFDLSIYSPAPGEFVAVFDVISARKRQEAELAASEERFSQAFHASPDAIAVTRLADGVYTLVNEGLERMLDRTAAELVGRSALELNIWVDPADRAAWRSELQAEGRVTSREVAFRRRDGSVVLGEVSSRVIALDGEAAQLSIIRDVTEQKRAAEERRPLEAEVEHMQKLDSLGRLAGGMAHDMNNVLSAIYAVTQSLRTRYRTEPELDESLSTVERAAARGRDLVRGLVAFTRKDLRESVSIDLNELVRQEVALLDRTLLQKYRVVVDLEEPLPVILGEPGPLGSALMNLCVNAVDAMPGGGTLTIRTRCRKEAERSWVEVTVVDTGEGMTPEVLRKAMEPFFTTKPAGKGTGLGLVMVFNTARAHGGSLALRSEPGQGTQALLSLPCAGAGARPALPVEAQPGPTAPRRILLVDDDELLRDSVPMMLELLGNRVDALDGGQALLDRLRADGGFDLVILDVNMPGLGGLETLGLLRQSRPELAVLLATGNLDAEVEAVLQRDPRTAAIAKPFTLDELRRKLAEV